MLEGAKYYRKRKGGSGGQRRAQKGRPVEKVVFEQARRNERVSPEVVQGKAFRAEGWQMQTCDCTRHVQRNFREVCVAGAQRPWGQISQGFAGHCVSSGFMGVRAGA